MAFAYLANGDDDPVIQRHKYLDERIRAIDALRSKSSKNQGF